jgi:hypothetical protein
VSIFEVNSSITPRTYKLLETWSLGGFHRVSKSDDAPERDENRKAIAKVCDEVVIKSHGGEDQVQRGEDPSGR